MNKKLAVVVGAGPGVGISVARKFGSQGFRVVLISRDKTSLDQHVKALGTEGIEAYGVAADAGSSASLKAAFDHIKQNYGPTEVLVYNAAVLKGGLPSSLTEDDIMNDLKVNVAGALTSALQVIPDQIERKQGTILFTGGGLALYPAASYSSLSIGKAAIRSLALSLGEELAPQGIFVGTVTIAGLVQPDGYFAPDRIAQAYWDLYQKRQEHEIIYQEE